MSVSFSQGSDVKRGSSPAYSVSPRLFLSSLSNTKN